ncbi:hypothetical protein [Gluconobacter japonicus]|uniref:hypothetical protein n=1 Tax=Gluconobacter japonicus TaxID=376620 RepID=UPI000793EAF4|nr:hypothetical protein [Gluconobacter japonicus]KXV20660.1 hypothetical protein AD935_11320 [Gluconobacter japonicus]
MSGTTTNNLVPVTLNVLAKQIAPLLVAAQLEGINISGAVVDGVAVSDAILDASKTALDGQKDAAGGVAALSSDLGLMLNGVEVMGASADGHLLIKVDLPTTDPGISGALWNNGQYVMVSAG